MKMCALREELLTNRKAWNQNHVAKKYRGACALPAWGPFGECSESELLGPLAGKTVLEVACGSGQSLSYVAQRGASKIHGVDFSSASIAMATELNRRDIGTGRVQLMEAPMEEELDLRDIDVAFSSYGLGWTLEPERVFSNLASYLKPGGKLVWSWEHPLFWKVRYEEGKMHLHDAYLNETVRREEKWSGSDGVYMVTRPIASWFRYLTTAGFIVREFLEPQPISITHAPLDPARYYSQAKLSNLPSTMIFVCEKPLER
jgi:SAM-dependent methyltransferase